MSPPADDFIAGYFKYEPPTESAQADSGEVDLGLPEYED